MIRKGIFATAAAWAAITGTVAQAQNVRPKSAGTECITAKEAEGLMLAVAPAALREVTGFCKSSLPANAYLRNEGPLIAKYEAASKGAQAGAMAAMSKLGGGELDSSMAGMLMPMMTQMVGSMLTKELKAKDCPSYDRVFRLMDPLPAENGAALLILIVQLSQNGKKDPEFPLCPFTGQ